MLVAPKKWLTFVIKQNQRRIKANACRNKYIHVLMMHYSDNVAFYFLTGTILLQYHSSSDFLHPPLPLMLPSFNSSEYWTRMLSYDLHDRGTWFLANSCDYYKEWLHRKRFMCCMKCSEMSVSKNILQLFYVMANWVMCFVSI